MKLVKRLDHVKDNELRERIIKAGISDLLINILQTRPLDLIT